MVVYVIQHEGAEPTDKPEDVKIIIEGVEVLQDVKDVANGCALLLGLIYCLNLEYPSNLKYTFHSEGVDGYGWTETVTEGTGPQRQTI